MGSTLGARRLRSVTRQTDKEFAGRFVPEIRQIIHEYRAYLGKAEVVVAPLIEDLQHNADLLVLRKGKVAIACRVRRHRYLDQYGRQFTIRERRPSGAKSELAKLLEGWGDYLFYGFADPHNRSLQKWLIGDLAVFRCWYRSEIEQRRIPPGRTLANRDRSSTFRVFDLRDVPLAFIVANKPRMILP